MGASIKLKSQSILIHQLLNIEPPTPSASYLPHTFIKLSNFCDIGSIRWRAISVLVTLEAKE